MRLKEHLASLGLKQKEIDVYLLLIEQGTQPAANLAKRVGHPKSTVLFICENLVKRGLARKSKRGITQFFYASPDDLREALTRELTERQNALDAAIPLLEEIKNPYSAEPKITFYEGTDGCRKAYFELLDSNTDILEFGVHKDLVQRFGVKFMDEFIAERTRRGVYLRSISNETDIDQELKKLDSVQEREQRFFSPVKGKTYSTIAIYEDNVLMLNLHADAFGVKIQNQQMSETLSTVFWLLWESLK